MNDVKQVIKEQIEKLLAEGVRPTVIEIELLHFMKKVIYADKH